MGGAGNTLADKAELGVIMYKTVLAGQHKPLAALTARLGNDIFQQHGGTAAATVSGDCIHAENHLPRAVFVMQGRVIVHLVPQVRLVRSHAIHKAHQLFAVHQHPKMVRIQRQPSGKAQFCGGFGSGEALGFNLYHSCQIGGSRGSDLHNNSPYIRRILPALGNYKLTDLRKEVIREFYEEMRHTPRLDGRGNLSEKSVEGLHNTLCGILSAAVDEGYLTHNPAWRCYKPKGQKKERPVADEETVKKLITAFEGQSMKYETYFKLVLATGLRRGEACGLRWSDINWRKRTIHVQRGVVKLSHQESITKDPKTSSCDRMVYLSKEMCQLLKAWRKECEWVRAQTANETVSENDYLFRQPNGKPMNPCTFTYRFKLILKANNLPLDLSVHSLRHTNASLLISQGVDVRTVASLLGHAQASTTLDIYAHAFDKNKRKAQEKLGKAIGL